MASWSDAILNVEALEYAGYTDWRVPNVVELMSLFDLALGGTTYAPRAPVNITNNDYLWTSTTHAVTTTSAWYIRMYTTAAGQIYMIGKTTNYLSVVPVRGGHVSA
jgi:hypothetical protein